MTDYVFDTLGNLRKTTQGEQNRYFMYDSLGRVLYARQVEQDANSNFSGVSYTDPITSNNQWSVKYQYDDNGNITSTTDARNLSISATYDHLNRLTFRDYSDSAMPDVTFYYDGTGLGSVPNYSKGKTTKITSSVSETRNTSFDIMGRLLTHQQITGGTTYSTAYSYNLSGALLEETYPSGRKVRNTLNSDGNLSLVETQPSGGSYATRASNFTYNAAGAISSMQLGNGRWESTQFNTRLQPTQIALGTAQNATDLLKLEYGYGTTDNNGSLKSQTITVPTVGGNTGFTATQTYAYDSLNRIQSATETISGTQSWKQTFSYDRYGNRRFDAANTTTLGSCGSSVCNPTIATSNNRFSTGQGYSYDSAGDVTQDATGQRFHYDSEQRQDQFFAANNGGSTPDATYYYDGSGQRIKKVSASESTIFVYDASGTLIEEYPVSNPTQVSTSYVGGLLSTETSSGTNYLTADHLGSPRIVTDSSGNVVSRKDYSAFGEETVTSQRTTGLGYNPQNIRQDYTGYQKDGESGLEYSQARYYNATHGRFTSPDPLAASATIRNPQTLNRYSYVTNSPYKFTDPLGLEMMCTGPCYGCSAASSSCDGSQNNELGGFASRHPISTMHTPAPTTWDDPDNGSQPAAGHASPPPEPTAEQNQAAQTAKGKLDVAFAARDSKDSDAENAFLNRAKSVNGGKALVVQFSTGKDIMDLLTFVSLMFTIPQVVIHDHGFVGGIIGDGDDVGLYTMDDIVVRNVDKNNGARTTSDFAIAVRDGKIDIAKNGSIAIFGCNCSTFAQELSAKLGAVGRGDIFVTGANNKVYEKNGMAAVRMKDGISNGSRGTFITYLNGIRVSTSRTRSYK